MGWWSQATGFVPASSEWHRRQARRLTTVVVPLDGTAASARVLGHLSRLSAAPSTLLDVVLLRIVGPEADAAAASAELVVHAQTLSRLGIRARTRIERGDAGPAIVAAAVGEGADLVAMTTRGQGGPRRLLGRSCAEAVVRGAPCPVLLVGPRAHRVGVSVEPLRRVLLPIDGGCEVVPDVERLVRAPAEALFLRIGPPGSDEAEAAGHLRPAVARLGSAWRGRRRCLLGAGRPVDGILEAIERERVDLVAMTTRPRRGLERLWLGSAAEGVARASPVPVLLRRGA